ncbi:MAG TPA: ABC transporter permease [Candidatus Borkfalkia avistercoris]|mgnify:FL=1|uniref:ABC transporter permease n=1 Tax=Candidatus Borkfalkia avistercoris TaxID=2838504 RepID=A0A9D2IEH5_9FIRM|nr:ABC transporter permease [Candidatus Borkfalkia avistercoris]
MMKLHFSRKQLCIPYALFLLLFVVIPMLMILFYAFTGEGADGGLTFTFANFADFFTSKAKLSTLLMSFTIAIISTAICLVIAYPLAYVLARSTWKKKYVLLMIFIMPMWINFVLRITALRELLDLIGLLGTQNYLNTIIGMVYDFLPFMILPLYTTLEKLDKSYLEAAADLGGNKFTVFTRVTFPLSMPGVISGITMVFMPSMTNYVVSDTLSNFNITILGKLIDEYFTTYDNWHMGSMISIILLVIIFLTLLATGGFKDEKDNARGANLW